jgi:hypothetical protein
LRDLDRTASVFDVEWRAPLGGPSAKETQPMTERQIVDVDGFKVRAKATWMAGDYGRVAEFTEATAEDFIARRHIRSGARVLDVACGTGNLANTGSESRRGGRRNRHCAKPARPSPLARQSGKGERRLPRR